MSGVLQGTVLAAILFVIMISDIDEIPDPKRIREFDIREKYACFLQKNFQSKINLTKLINIDTFESLTATFKTSDKKYKLETIQGLIDFTNDINSCLKQRDEIITELSEIFKNREKLDNGKTVHWAEKNSYTYDYYIFFGSKSDWPIDHILVSCYDWSKKSGYMDHLRVAIVKEDYMRWLEKLSKN